MIYRSFNEGLLGKSNNKKVDESFYKFCKDIMTYIFEEEARVWEKKEGFVPEECDYGEYESIEEKISKIKNNNDSICRYSFFCFEYSTLEEEKKIISKAASKFRLKPANNKSILTNLDNYSFIKHQNDGSLISIDICIRCVVCKGNTLAPHTVFFKIKYYEDRDKAKEKLNLKESTSCGIFNNI